MKKSEMIQVMLFEYRGYNNTEDYNRSKMIMEDVLNAMLEQGMLPPRWIPEDHGYIYGDEPSGEPNGFKISVNKWEPEDE